MHALSHPQPGLPSCVTSGSVNALTGPFIGITTATLSGRNYERAQNVSSHGRPARL